MTPGKRAKKRPGENRKGIALFIGLIIFLFAGIILVQNQSLKKDEKKTAFSHYKEGLGYFQQGYFEDALFQFQQVLKENPQDVQANYLAGKSTAALGELDKALPYLAEAVKLAPQNAEYHYSLGLLYKDLNQNLAAINELKKSLTGAKFSSSLSLLKELNQENEKKETRPLPPSESKLKKSLAISSIITFPEEGGVIRGETLIIKGTAENKEGTVVKVEVSTDGGTSWQEATSFDGFQTWSALWNIPHIEDEVFLKSRAVGNFGSTEFLEYTVKVKVDNVAPSLFYLPDLSSFNRRKREFSKPPKISLHTDSSSSIIYYHWDKERWHVYGEPLRPPKRGLNNLSYFAKDAAGNVTEIKNEVIFVK